jgi:hypothetical protein
LDLALFAPRHLVGAYTQFAPYASFKKLLNSLLVAKKVFEKFGILSTIHFIFYTSYHPIGILAGFDLTAHSWQAETIPLDHVARATISFSLLTFYVFIPTFYVTKRLVLERTLISAEFQYSNNRQTMTR